MGQLIRKNAAVENLVDVVGDTLTNARSRGGVWQQLAEDRLGVTEAILNKIDDDIVATEKALAPLEADIATMDKRADAYIGEKADEIWNKIGRPGYDPFYALMFPEGIAGYTEVSDEDQPAHMVLLGGLLEANLHPRLEPAYTKGIATELYAIAKDYRSIVDTVHPLRVKLNQLKKTRAAVARGGHAQLVNLKRAYIIAGFSEAEIHEVIPAVPKRRKGSKS